jgi:hypothetical protein
MFITYSPLSKSYSDTELSSHPATKNLPSWEMSIEFISFYYISRSVKYEV